MAKTMPKAKPKVGLLALTLELYETLAPKLRAGREQWLRRKVLPALSPAAIVGIAVPLFIVTMASQNIPGMAVMAVNGYRPDAGLMFRATGLSSVLGAPFGAHAVCLAAITAASPTRPRRSAA